MLQGHPARSKMSALSSLKRCCPLLCFVLRVFFTFCSVYFEAGDLFWSQSFSEGEFMGHVNIWNFLTPSGLCLRIEEIRSRVRVGRRKNSLKGRVFSALSASPCSRVVGDATDDRNESFFERLPLTGMKNKSRRTYKRSRQERCSLQSQARVDNKAC